MAKASLNLMRVNIEEMERTPNPTPQVLEMIRSQRSMLGAYEELFQAMDAIK